MFVKWNQNYSIGIKTLDDEHKKLLDILNIHYDAIVQEKDRDTLLTIFEKLRIYAKTHFSDEEKYMIKYKYPDYAKQKMDHEYFVRKINEFEEDWINGYGTLSTEISIFLKKWLLTHISVEDKKIGLFINSPQ